MKRTIAGMLAGAVALAGAAAWATQDDRFSEKALLDLAPPGPHVGLKPDQVKVPGFSSKDRLVGTYYFYWYDDASRAHFVDGDGSDALTDHPAEPKGYSYKSPDWHRREMLDLIDAGIDVVLPVYWASPATHLAGCCKWSFEGLPPLVAAQEKLLAEGRTPPRIGLFYDTSTLQYNAAGRHVDLTTADGRAWFYVTIRDFFSLIPPARWATIDGRPIIFLYAAAFAAKGGDDPALVAYVREHFARDFGGAVPYLVAERSWRLPADSTYAWGAAFGLQVLGVASLGPGYDDSAVPGRTTPRQDREGGAFYRRLWERLLAIDPARRPHLVTIETWNELHEGTDIAASREYGRQYIDLTRTYAAAWKAGERRKPTGSYAAVAEVALTFGPEGKSAGITLKTGADGEASPAEAAGSACIQVLPNRFNKDQYLYFEVDDSFYFDSGEPVEVALEYLDEGTEPVRLDYDSADPAATLDGAYKVGGSVSRADSATWKRAAFALKDARFMNRENLGSDLRLYTPGSPLKVRRIEVRKAPAPKAAR